MTLWKTVDLHDLEKERHIGNVPIHLTFNILLLLKRNNLYLGFLYFYFEFWDFFCFFSVSFLILWISKAFMKNIIILLSSLISKLPYLFKSINGTHFIDIVMSVQFYFFCVESFHSFFFLKSIFSFQTS
jgi:hypothetical protein